MSKLTDLSGKKYGRLTVLERAESVTTPCGAKMIKWKCQCDCEKIHYALSGNIVRGNTKSCGCIKKEDLTGKRFGMLTAVEVVKVEGKESRHWKCVCDCGKEVVIDGVYLRNGTTKSCGCSTRRSNNKKGKKNRYETNPKNENETFVYDCNGNYTVIDTEDADKTKELYWRKSQSGYWVHQDRKVGMIMLHRFLMNAPQGKLVDHVFHNTDDNRKEMLRICTDQENQINRTPKKRKSNYPVGVYKTGRKYRATLRLKQISLREEFEKLEDAIAKRKEWEEKYLGEFAYKEQ